MIFDHQSDPFEHYVITEALPRKYLEEALELGKSLTPASIENGIRGEINNRLHLRKKDERHQMLGDYLDGQFRLRLVEKFAAAGEEGWESARRIEAEELRAEICCDGNGFWLEPHLDVRDKSVTAIVYLTGHECGDLGTDLYNEDKEVVKSCEYGVNRGLVFIPGEKTWHGFEPNKRFRKDRLTLIINYVRNWKESKELYNMEESASWGM